MIKRSKFCSGLLFLATGFLWPCSPAFSADIELKVSLVGNQDMGNFRQPGGLFFDENKKRVYIADTGNNRLVSFDMEYNPIAEFDANGKLKLPSDVVRDKNGVFYLLAGRKKEFTKIDLARKKYETVVIRNAPSKANPIFPGRLAIDASGKLYVTDKGNGRILVLDKDGGFLREISFPGRRTSFSDIRVDPEGILYALSTIDRKVYIFGRNGKLMKEFGEMGEGSGQFLFPVSLAVDKLKRVYVLDQHKGKVLVFEKGGMFL
ncbi:MAG: NHL repeat-containing protein, partial [Nitrospinota bacterium]